MLSYASASRDYVMLRIPPESFLNIPPANDPFMMDFENYCLSKWDATKHGVPTGRERWKDEPWAAHMQQELEFSDCTWAIYVHWCLKGGGDELFMEDENSGDDKWTTTDENKDCSNFTKTLEDPGPVNFEST